MCVAVNDMGNLVWGQNEASEPQFPILIDNSTDQTSVFLLTVLFQSEK